MPYTGGAFGYTISDYYDERQEEKDFAIAAEFFIAVDEGRDRAAAYELSKPEVHAAVGRWTAYYEKTHRKEGE